MIINAIYENGVFTPVEAIDLPEKRKVRLSVETAEPSEETPAATPDDRPLMKLADIAQRYPRDPNAPIDGAAQHDHYLYGTPKRP